MGCAKVSEAHRRGVKHVPGHTVGPLLAIDLERPVEGLFDESLVCIVVQVELRIGV